MKLEVAGATAVVTGASRGIGAATARALAREGVAVALLARSEADLHRLADELRGAGARAVSIVADMARRESIAEAFTRAQRELGPIDILVNNAGASPFGSFDEVSDTEWIDAFELKVLGYARCIRAVLPEMRARGAGRIVNVVGMAGRSASPRYALGAYNAALLHLTKGLADLVAGDGIRVLAVNPGLTSSDRMITALATWAKAANEDTDTFTQSYVSRIPLGRAATPEEIAMVICVLCSPVGDLAVGSAFQADGGAAHGAF